MASKFVLMVLEEDGSSIKPIYQTDTLEHMFELMINHLTMGYREEERDTANWAEDNIKKAQLMVDPHARIVALFDFFDNFRGGDNDVKLWHLLEVIHTLDEIDRYEQVA